MLKNLLFAKRPRKPKDASRPFLRCSGLFALLLLLSLFRILPYYELLICHVQPDVVALAEYSEAPYFPFYTWVGYCYLSTVTPGGDDTGERQSLSVIGLFAVCLALCAVVLLLMRWAENEWPMFVLLDNTFYWFAFMLCVVFSAIMFSAAVHGPYKMEDYDEAYKHLIVQPDRPSKTTLDYCVFLMWWKKPVPKVLVQKLSSREHRYFLYMKEMIEEQHADFDATERETE